MRKVELLGRLQDDRAADCESRTQLPGGHQQGEVPGNDLSDDADSLAERVGEVLCAGRIGNRERDRVALDLGRPSGHVAEQIDGEGNVGRSRDRERFAVVETFEIGELVGVASRRSARFQMRRPRSEAVSLRQGP